MKNTKMLYFDRIDVSEEIDVNKTSESKKSHICCYWYFLNIRIKFQRHVCNGCHDFLMMSMNLNDIAISNLKNSLVAVLLAEKSKSEAISLIRNVDLTKKVEHYST